MPNVITSAIFLLTESKKNGKYVFGNFADLEESRFVTIPKAYENFIETIKNKQLLMDINTLRNLPKNLNTGNLFYISKQVDQSFEKAIRVETLSKGIKFAKDKALENNQSHIYIIGQAKLIKQCLKENLLDEIQLTYVYNFGDKISEPVYLDFDLNQWKIVDDSGIFTSENPNSEKISYRYLKLNSKYKLNEF